VSRGGRPRRSKHQRRIEGVLASLPSAREQLLVAIEDLGASPAAFSAAGASQDPRERNRLATVERVFEELVNWVDELAARALGEAVRRNLVPKATGSPYGALVDQGAISRALAEQLEQAKSLRDVFQHGYPPRDWDAAHAVITAFPAQLDRFVDGFARWLDDIGLLS
jgi:hypothetical protein